MRYLPALFIFGASGVGYLWTHGLGEWSPAKWVATEEIAAESSASDFETRDGESSAGQVSVQPGDAAPVRQRVRPGRDEPSLIAAESTNAVHPVSLADALRFEITPSQVRSQWGRISAGLSEPRWQGMRVGLVTGTAATDLAGSLTYFFDDAPRLRRLTFAGSTADPHDLVLFLRQQFGFHRVRDGNARVTVYTAGLPWRGTLRVTPPEGFDRDDPNRGFEVELTIDR